MNSPVDKAQRAIAAFARDEPWSERMAEVRRLLTAIRDEPTDIDKLVVDLINDALNPNLTEKEAEQAFVEAIATVIRVESQHP